MDKFLKKLEADCNARFNERQERIEQLMLMAISKGGKLPSSLADELRRLIAMQETLRQIDAKSDKQIMDEYNRFCKK